MTNEEVREVLQEQIDKYGQEYDDKGIEALKTAIKLLEQTKWIPVSERLPEDEELILFSTKTEVFEGRYFNDETEHQWYSFRDECFAWNNVVTAWMPLPEPYTAESEE